MSVDTQILNRWAVGLLLLSGLRAFAMQPTAEDGFRHFYNLEYDEAIASFQAEIAAQPERPDGYNHVAQALLYRGYYRAGLLENSLVSGEDFLLSLIRQPKLVLSAEDDRAFDLALESAERAAQRLLSRNERDAGALYALGVTRGLRANYDFLVRKSWFAALRESTSARKLHNRAAQIDPSNADALLMQGLQEYVVASLPAALRLLGAITGLHGDKLHGLALIDQVARHGDCSRVEAKMVLFTLYRHEKKPWSAMSYLYGLRKSYPRNYLLHLAEIYTNIEMRDERAAGDSLHALERARAEGAPGYEALQEAKVEYTRGVIQCRFGHLEQALASMRRAAANSQAEMQLMAFERVGMIHDMRGDRAEAVQAYQHVVEAAPDSRMGKESQRYLSRPFQGYGAD